MSLPDSVQALFDEPAVVWGFLLAAALVLVLTPLAIRVAPLIGAQDLETDRPRVHSGAIPRTGGLAIVAGILIPGAIFVHPDSGPLLGIMIGTACVAVIGLIDDTRGLRPSHKLLGVAAVALIPVVGYDLTIDHITLPLIGTFDFGWIAYPLTVLWIVTIANLVNLIDGMDALAAGIVAIAALTAGSTLAFLRHNYHPAKVFMGDTGALALGFLLASIAVEGVTKTAATIALAGPLLVLAVPILDTAFVVLKRLKYRRAPWGADHNHFYHRFLRIGFSQRRTVAYLHLWAILVSAFAILVRFLPPRPHAIWDLGNSLIVGAAGLVVLAASVWMVYRLEILKARHLQAVGLGRFAREPEEETEQEEAVEEALMAGPRR
jgi:UDP-GlcNAc:undecaprenyl-phosphate GlcNAc-1-phosphate transferase